MKTNIGVQLYPIVLLMASFGFFMLGAKALFWTCFLMAGLFWMVLFSDSIEKK